MIKCFEDLRAWQLARVHSKAITALCRSEPMRRDFGLIDQISRAVGSVMDNLAEGFDRGSRGEFRQFLGYAKGSTGEVRSQLYRAADRGYLDNATLETLLQQNDEISRIIRGLIDSTNTSPFQGSRYPKDLPSSTR